MWKGGESQRCKTEKGKKEKGREGERQGNGRGGEQQRREKVIHTEDIKFLVQLLPCKDHCTQVGRREAIHSFLVVFIFLDFDAGSRMGFKSAEWVQANHKCLCVYISLPEKWKESIPLCIQFSEVCWGLIMVMWEARNEKSIFVMLFFYWEGRWSRAIVLEEASWARYKPSAWMLCLSGLHPSPWSRSPQTFHWCRH